MPGTWQGGEQIIVGQILGNGSNLGIEAINGLQDDTQLLNQRLHDHLAWPDNGLILGKCGGSPDALDAFFDKVDSSTIVLVKEGFNG